MRSILTVIDTMLMEIPVEEGEFRDSLKSVYQSAAFSAPELMALRWRTGAEVLSDYISQDEKDWTDWQRRVVAIWMGENE